jgi:hypothetical protein
MQAGSAGELKRRTVASTGRTGSAIENAGRFRRRIKARNCRVGRTDARTHQVNLYIRYGYKSEIKYKILTHPFI